MAKSSASRCRVSASRDVDCPPEWLKLGKSCTCCGAALPLGKTVGRKVECTCRTGRPRTPVRAPPVPRVSTTRHGAIGVYQLICWLSQQYLRRRRQLTSCRRCRSPSRSPIPGPSRRPASSGSREPLMPRTAATPRCRLSNPDQIPAEDRRRSGSRTASQRAIKSWAPRRQRSRVIAASPLNLLRLRVQRARPQPPAPQRCCAIIALGASSAKPAASNITFDCLLTFMCHPPCVPDAPERTCPLHVRQTLFRQLPLGGGPRNYTGENTRLKRTSVPKLHETAHHIGATFQDDRGSATTTTNSV